MIKPIPRMNELTPKSLGLTPRLRPAQAAPVRRESNCSSRMGGLHGVGITPAIALCDYYYQIAPPQGEQMRQDCLDQGPSATTSRSVERRDGGTCHHIPISNQMDMLDLHSMLNRACPAGHSENFLFLI